MKKPIKALLWTIATLLLLLVIGIGSLVTLVNPNRFKNQIVSQIEKATGRKASIANIGWNFFPWLKLEVDGLSLSNPAGFANPTFASIGESKISVDLLALLQQKIIIDKLSMQDAQLNLIKSNTGQNNWTFKPSATTEKTTSTSPTSDSNNNTNIALHHLAINNLGIHWQDGKKDTLVKLDHLAVDNFNLENKPFNIDSKLAYQASANLKPVPININTEVTIDNKKKIELSNLRLALAQFEIKGKALLSASPNNTLQANLTISKANLATLLNDLGYALQFKDSKALSEVSGDFTLLATPNSLSLQPLNLTIDNSHLSGQIKLTQLAPLTGSYALNLDQIDFNQYQLSSAASSAPVQTNNQATTTSSNSSVPMKNNDNLSGKLDIGKLVFNQFVLQQVHIPLTWYKGMLTASPTAALYQGQLQSTLQINYNSTAPIYTLNCALNNISIQSLLAKPNKASPLTGTGNINLKVTTVGTNQTALLNALNGKGSINLKDGSFTQLDILDALNTAASIFFKKPPAQTQSDKQTTFSQLQASFTILNGKLSNQDLSLNSSLMQVTGKGEINLVTQQINYHLAVKPDADAIPGMANLQKAIGDNIPLLVTGSINSPVILPDPTQMTLGAGKQTVQEIGKNVDKASKELAKSLGDFFK